MSDRIIEEAAHLLSVKDAEIAELKAELAEFWKAGARIAESLCSEPDGPCHYADACGACRVRDLFLWRTK